MSSRLLDSPLPASFHPLLFTWERKRTFIRCYNSRYGAKEFNPGQGDGRFHPFPDQHGKVVSTLYAADQLEGALSETVFRDVPFKGPEPRIRRSILKPLVLATLCCDRDLVLAQLFGLGLRRLAVSRLDLIETDSDRYSQTRAWARALHGCNAKIDGLVWVSRLNDGTRSLVLFGDRVSAADLQVIGKPLTLASGSGFDEVQKAADQAGILILD